MATTPQDYAHHRRIDPTYHGLIFSIFIANLVITAVATFHHRDFTHIWMGVMAAALLLLFLKLRTYALHNQDRLIRLEERLRMERLLPEDLKARISELRVGQLVGLRFASDGELTDRVREALTENLNGAAIKQRIQSWRADNFRV